MASLSASPPAPGRARRRRAQLRIHVALRSACGLLALLAILFALVDGAPAEATPAQVPGATVTTTAPVTATTTVTTEARTSSTRVADENRRVWVIVGGLVVVALAILALTVTYWRHTDPARAAARAGSGPRNPTVDEPAAATATPEVPILPDLIVGDEVGDEPAEDTGELDVLDPRADDATHAGVGAGWEPRATGEVEQISVPAVVRTTRPTRDQRALVLGIERPGPAAEQTET